MLGVAKFVLWRFVSGSRALFTVVCEQSAHGVNKVSVFLGDKNNIFTPTGVSFVRWQEPRIVSAEIDNNSHLTRGDSLYLYNVLFIRVVYSGAM